jgi:hypothetical protein
MMMKPKQDNATQSKGLPSGDQGITKQKSEHGMSTPRDERVNGVQVEKNSDTPEGVAVILTEHPQVFQKVIKKRGAQRKPLECLGDLLRTVYGGKAKRLKLKKAEISAIRFAYKMEPSDKEELLTLSASDRTLVRTLELMLISMEGFDNSVLASQVQEFVRELLRRHPAFHLKALSGVFGHNSDGPSEDEVVQALISQSYTTLSWPEGLEELKKQEAEQCRMNALCCLLLWFRKARGITFEQIQHYLQAKIWIPAANRHKTDAEKLRVLMTPQDSSGIAVACSALETQVFERRQQAAAARRAEEHAVKRSQELERILDDVKGELWVTRDKVVHLTKDLSSVLEDHKNVEAHLRDDYEQLRGRVLRRLKEEVSLIEEGLHALRRDPPKIHVMEDHAERAIDGLKREMERIRGRS